MPHEQEDAVGGGEDRQNCGVRSAASPVQPSRGDVGIAAGCRADIGFGIHQNRAQQSRRQDDQPAETSQ